MLETYSKWEEQFRIRHFGETGYLIYILKVKETQEVFYVGCTTMTLKKRLNLHIYNAYNADNYMCPKFVKIRNIYKNKHHILAVGLFYAETGYIGDDGSYARWCESACIEILSKTYKLTNVQKFVRNQDSPPIYHFGTKDAWKDLLNEIERFLCKELA